MCPGTKVGVSSIDTIRITILGYSHDGFIDNDVLDLYARGAGIMAMMTCRLWLDDVRNPHEYGYIGWHWVKTYDEAIAVLETGCVTEASLDHDLSFDASMGLQPPDEKTGYHVVCWMEQHNVWPSGGVKVHSMNPVGKRRMLDVIKRYY
jgi:hypothetical protein